LKAVASDRPLSAELLNDGAPTTPRPAATVIVVRDAPAGLEVLLVQRNPAQRFMGGYWVFPGGAVDAHEGEGETAHRAAAVRELHEEAGVDGVDPAELVHFSRWITPELLRIRFDTHFFVARAPEGVRARPDGRECVALRWDTPAAVLQRHAAGELVLAFPTLCHVEELAAFADAGTLFEHARSREVRPVLPRALRSGEVARLVLPGEPGYEA